MVFMDRGGHVLEGSSWRMARVLGMFTGIWLVIVAFFKTLMAPFKNNDDQSSSSSTRRGGWSSGGGGGPSGGGGGGGSGGGGFNQGLRPNRRIGRVVNTSMDCNIPGGG